MVYCPAAEHVIAVAPCQAIHNFIVHYLRPRCPDLLHFEALQVHNDDSPIYTVGVIEPPRMTITNNSFAVYNRRGNMAPIVHQVDRRKQLRIHAEALSQEQLNPLLMERA